MCAIDGEITVNSMQKLASHCQKVQNFQEKKSTQNNQDSEQKSRVFYLFGFVSQGNLNDCVTSILHLLLHPVELTEQSVVVQEETLCLSKAVILATDNPSNR